MALASSAEQNDARQLEGMELEKVFTDRPAEKTVKRPQLQAMLAHVRDGDHLYVHSMDRLSRSLKDLQEVVESLTAKGVSVSFVKEGVTFQRPGKNDAHEAA